MEQIEMQLKSVSNNNFNNVLVSYTVMEFGDFNF